VPFEPSPASVSASNLSTLNSPLSIAPFAPIPASPFAFRVILVVKTAVEQEDERNEELIVQKYGLTPLTAFKHMRLRLMGVPLLPQPE
jgi:hypothetical protein